MRSLPEPLTRVLTRGAKPWFTVVGRRWCSFQVMGAAGFALAAGLSLSLTRSLNQRPAVTAMMIAVAVGCFFLLAHLRKIVEGRERLTYYHHEIVILASCAGVLKITGQQVLPYLDVAALSLALFLAVGRVGCFLVGCCHGRPSFWGVRYGAEAVEAGFARHLEGVRLSPVQLMESAWVLATVAGGLVLIRSAPAGTALAWYSVVYGWGRFLLEFERGDAERPYRMGFSEAQWTSLFLMALTVLLEFTGILPFSAWHIAAALALAATMALIRAAGDPARWLSHPRHVQQLAALVAAPRIGMKPGIGATSLGIRISASVVEDRGGRVELIAFSGVEATLAPERARRLATLAARLKGVEHETRVFPGRNGVYHLILPSGAKQDAL